MREPGFAPFGAADGAYATRLVELLADHDDAFLAAYVDGGGSLPYDRLHKELARQSKRALVHPVYYGSAITGAGVDALTAGGMELLPADRRDASGPVDGTVFKVETQIASNCLHVQVRRLLHSSEDRSLTRCRA
jgi:ribosomal protection tetracycline resistance protein